MINEFKTISDKELPEFKSKLILASKLMGICQEDYQDWFSNDRAGLDINKIELESKYFIGWVINRRPLSIALPPDKHDQMTSLELYYPSWSSSKN